jgi:hypothetical protein
VAVAQSRAIFSIDDPAPAPKNDSLGPDGRKKRALDDFMEEIKRKQADRDKRRADGQPDMMDDGSERDDSTTTNVHAQPIPTDVRR